jgi:hypothetical protein
MLLREQTPCLLGVTPVVSLVHFQNRRAHVYKIHYEHTTYDREFSGFSSAWILYV